MGGGSGNWFAGHSFESAPHVDVSQVERHEEAEYMSLSLFLTLSESGRSARECLGGAPHGSLRAHRTPMKVSFPGLQV